MTSRKIIREERKTEENRKLIKILNSLVCYFKILELEMIF